jgi:hypothetical protein
MSKNSNHTPGPWRVAYPLGRIEVVTDGPAIYCQKICSDVTPRDARLIAASPKLLDALQCLVQATSCYARHSEEHKYACTVIAEATGRAA